MIRPVRGQPANFQHINRSLSDSVTTTRPYRGSATLTWFKPLDLPVLCYRKLPSGPAFTDGEAAGQPGQKDLDFKRDKDQRPNLKLATEDEILRRNHPVLVIKLREKGHHAKISEEVTP